LMKTRTQHREEKKTLNKEREICPIFSELKKLQ
jgi:hypothetical protein